MSVNKKDSDSEVRRISIKKSETDYLNYSLEDLLEFDLKESQYLHPDVEGEFSRYNGLHGSWGCRQLGLIIWLASSEIFSIHLFMSGTLVYENQYR